MKASELSDAARCELDMGWTQGEYSNYQGNVCAIGALERVAMKNMAIGQAGLVQQELDAKAHEMSNGEFDRVQSFNDDRNTTKQDVLNLFDKVTIGLEEKGL